MESIGLNEVINIAEIDQPCNKIFKRFINWVSGEFDLLLQEEFLNKLIVYYPGGNIEIEKKSENIIVSWVDKTGKNGEKLADKVLKIYAHVENFN